MTEIFAKAPLISIVTPAYNEGLNLPIMHERLETVLHEAGADWEWIIIDDCSRDDADTSCTSSAVFLIAGTSSASNSPLRSPARPPSTRH